jgi:hypothetical protein
MMPWYKRKKVWTAILTAAAQVVAEALGKPELGQQLLIVGTALIGAFALEDVGKAAKAATTA